jgi:hypothetical protein
MNGKKCKVLRAQADNRKSYQHLKKSVSAQARTDAAQAPTPVKLRTHKRKAAIKPTWPDTFNQHTQRRPLIVMRPIRALVRAVIEMTPADPETGQRCISRSDLEMVAWVSTMPKHAIDARVCSL